MKPRRKITRERARKVVGRGEIVCVITHEDSQGNQLTQAYRVHKIIEQDGSLILVTDGTYILLDRVRRICRWREPAPQKTEALPSECYLG